MKLLPAALLSLLSAASSILPSAAVNESSSGVARKLSSKAEKSGDDDDKVSRRDRIARGLELYGVARKAVILFDDDDNGVVNDEERMALLTALDLVGNDLSGSIPGDIGPLDIFTPIFELYKDADQGEVEGLVKAIAVGQDLEYIVTA